MPRRLISLCLCLTLLATFALPAAAQVGGPPTAPLTIDNCNANVGGGMVFTESSFTSKLVHCLKGTIMRAVTEMLQALSDYMFPTAVIMLVFALVVFGMRIMGGEDGLKRKALDFTLRAVFVLYFADNLGGFSEYIFLTEDWLITLVSGADYDPWLQIDTFLGNLLGFGQDTVLYRGLMGLIGGSLLSSTVGIILSVAGLMALIDILLFIIRTVFTFLVAYLMMAFMIIISPLIIPMALFFLTRRFFQKWLHILISAMLMPILLFAFLYMFVGVFDTMIGNIFTILGFPPCGQPGDPGWWTGCAAPDFRAYWKLNQPLFSWLMPGDPSMDQVLTNISGSTDLSNPAIQSNVTPWARRATDIGFGTPGIDFGLNDVGVKQQLVFAFISLWIFASLMKSMVGKIPEIADGIAEAISHIGIQQISLTRTVNEAKAGVAQGMQNIGSSISRQAFGGSRR